MASNGGWVYVDDTDTSIIYSGGDWKMSKNEGPSSNSGVFDGTLHGASYQGITATLKFTGSEVGVIGTTGLTDVYGWPAVDFSIDGVQQSTNTFPPGISPTTLFTNVTFFDATVTSGEHILTITNLNGTVPNMFWFDYIYYRPLVSTEAPPANSASVGSSPGVTQPASVSQSLSTPQLTGASGSLSTSTALGSVSTSQGPTATGGDGTTSGSTTSAPSTTSASLTDPRSATANHTGAIVGGAVGGAALLVLIAVVVVFRCVRRPKENWDNADDVTSDAPARSTATFSQKEIVPTATTYHGPEPILTSMTPSTSAAGESSRDVASPEHAVAAPPVVGDAVPPASRSKSRARALARRVGQRISRPMVQEVDSGFRLPRDESVVGTLPPPYTPE